MIPLTCYKDGWPFVLDRTLIAECQRRGWPVIHQYRCQLGHTWTERPPEPPARPTIEPVRPCGVCGRRFRGVGPKGRHRKYCSTRCLRLSQKYCTQARKHGVGDYWPERQPWWKGPVYGWA